jgi:hypothetical protein
VGRGGNGVFSLSYAATTCTAFSMGKTRESSTNGSRRDYGQNRRNCEDYRVTIDKALSLAA